MLDPAEIKPTVTFISKLPEVEDLEAVWVQFG